MPDRFQSYEVAGHVFSLGMDAVGPVRPRLENYAPFRVDTPGAGGEVREPVFALKLVEALDLPPARPLCLSGPEAQAQEQRIDVLAADTGDYVIEMAPWGTLPTAGKILVDRDFTEGKLLVVHPEYSEFCINNALMLLYAFRTATLGTLEMHASVTVCDGRGYLFLGNSGTGKSTHSSLWLRHIPGTQLLNDDNPVIRVCEGIARVYGTPWSGKTPCYRNEDFPVGAIVRINQAPRNAIREMQPAEILASLYASSSGLRAIRSIGDGLFSTIASVAGSVPCYLLDCLPDREAAELCHKTVTSHGK